MKKVSGKLLALLCTLIVLAGGAVLVMLSVPEIGPLGTVNSRVVSFLSGSPGFDALLFLTGGLGMALAVVAACLQVCTGPSARFVTFQGELGSINVSAATIEDLIAHGAEAIREVRRISATVNTSGDGHRLNIRAYISIVGGHDVKQVSEQVQEYISKHAVPVNRLHQQNYPSVGCEPCTRAVAPNADPRSGRWWWESDELKECGLHVQEQSEGSGI